MAYYREIYCCECKKVVNARFTDWNEVYPHLRELPYTNFYICDKCKNFVGVHKGTNIPLGTIPTKEIKKYIKETDIEERLKKPFKKGKNYSITYFTFKEIRVIALCLTDKFNGFFMTSIDNFYKEVMESLRGGTDDYKDILEDSLIEVFDDYGELEYYVKKF